MKNLFISILGFLVACAVPEKGNHISPKPDGIPLSHAVKFRMWEDTLEVTEPWRGATSPQVYPLTNPPTRVVVTSTTHLPFIEMLGMGDRLVGFPGTQYISSGFFADRVDKGLITELGTAGGMNLELLIHLRPDVVIAYDMGNESASLDKLAESGIPVLYNADYLETSALGRAEWIRFFGHLFQKDDLADSLFAVIEHNYDSLKALTANVAEQPTVFSGVMYGDAWFLPGGNSWAAGFYQDAGASYLWGSNENTGSLELSFESVMEKAGMADYWVGVSSFHSLQELEGQDDRYGQFAAFQNRKVYNFDKRVSKGGGFDFFESGYARPDRVLSDMIAIFHPELLPAYTPYYFQPLP